MKTKKIKARKMWRSETGTLWTCRTYARNSKCLKPETMFVIPADAESMSQMIHQITIAFAKSNASTASELACHALAAIGIPSRAPKSSLPNAQAEPRHEPRPHAGRAKQWRWL